MKRFFERRLFVAVALALPLVSLAGQRADPRTVAPPGEPAGELATKLEEARVALETNRCSTNDLLWQSEWSALRPYTKYRELIRQYAKQPKAALAPHDEPGERLVMTLTILDRDRKPVANALVYAYQTSAKGWYAAEAPHISGNEGDFKHARLFGYGRTGSKGEFWLNTVRPAGYPESTLPQHIHLQISADGFAMLGTEVQFDDDPRQTQESRAEAAKHRVPLVKPTKDEKSVWRAATEFVLERV